MPIDGRRPFMELVECAQNELIRESASGEEPKYKGLINSIYSNDLPKILPELYIKKEAYITTVAAYSAGSVTVGSGTSNIIGVSTSWTSGNSNNRLIDISGADTIFRVTFAASTDLSYQDGLTWTASSGTGKTYTLFTDRYALPSDFSHMVSDSVEEPHIVYRFLDGNKVYLDPLSEEEFNRDDALTTGTPWGYQVRWIKENPYLYLTLAADSQQAIGYSYIPQLTTLTEYIAGTVTFTTGTAVIASGSLWSTSITTGTNTYYIRNDADGTGSSSKWGKISTVANDTALTLASAWGSFTSGAGQTYTISEISKWPSRFDDAMLYRCALIADPDNVQNQKWNSLYLDAVGMSRSEESKRDQTRPFRAFPGLRGQQRRGYGR